MTLTPLGDQALLAYCSDEETAIRVARSVRSADPAWLEDVVPAYACVGIYFNANTITLSEVMHWLRSLSITSETSSVESRSFIIPICYEMQLDFERIREMTGLADTQIIHHHLACTYHVRAIGFVPGFPYMGELANELCGVGRLPSPRVRLDAGSVGITGRQTAVYPLPRPGGWNIVGRTPLVLVDVEAGFFPLRVGDQVRFQRINEQEYREYEGERLSPAPDRSAND